MARHGHADSARDARTFTDGRRWFSRNDDKAWGEKLYVLFTPLFFLYNAVIQAMSWLDVGNFWHVAQNALMWIPYCILLPLILRRHSPLPFYRQWWFKFQLYIAIIVFFFTYFHTEYFFDVLGMRYNFPHVTLLFDSVLLGPDQLGPGAAADALARHVRVPVGMYLNACAFFTVYHACAIVVMRRLINLAADLGGRGRVAAVNTDSVRVEGWSVAVWSAFAVAAVVSALFFAWAETFLYMTAPAHLNVWYIDLPTQLWVGSMFYALDFVFTFPNVYFLDERRGDVPWSLGKVAVNAAAMTMFVLLVDDVWTMIAGARFAGV